MRIRRKVMTWMLTAAYMTASLGGLQGSECFAASPAVSDTAAKDAKAEDRVIVSLGDSYSSGEGIPHFYNYKLKLEERVKDQDWIAHRSENSWPGMLKLKGVSGTMKKNRGEHWYFAAASGAKIEDLTQRQEKDYCKLKTGKGSVNTGFDFIEGTTKLDPQLSVFDELGGKHADYVTITMGGNDMEFQKVIEKVATGTWVTNYSGLKSKIQGLRKKLKKGSDFRKDLKAAYKNIAKKAGDHAHIIVAGYPRLFNEEGKGFVESKFEAGYVNDAVSDFNLVLQETVNECREEGINIAFVSVEKAFKGHQANDKGAYINGINLFPEEEDIDDISVSSAYSMHPNKDGAKAYAACVQAEIDRYEEEKKAPKGETPSEEKPTEKPTEKPSETPITPKAEDPNLPRYKEQLLVWAESSDRYSPMATDRWAIEEDQGLWRCFNSFAVTDVDGDGKTELAVWKEESTGEYDYSKLQESTLVLYRWEADAKDVREYDSRKLVGKPQDMSIWKGGLPIFYPCTNQGLDQFFKETGLGTDSRLEKLLRSKRYTFDEDRKRYKAYMDDLQDALKHPEEEGYSSRMEEKWGCGAVDENYTFVDLDGDGNRELMVWGPTYDSGCRGLLTYRDGKIKAVASAGHSSHFRIMDIFVRVDGYIRVSIMDSSTGDSGVGICIYENGELKVEKGYIQVDDGKYYAMNSDMKVDEGKVLTQKEVDDLKQSDGVCGFDLMINPMEYYR